MEQAGFTPNLKERIRIGLEDYYNNFVGLSLILGSMKGIEGVRESIRGYKIPTVGEHLARQREQRREVITIKDQEDPTFIQKAKMLDELANIINSLGEKVDAKTIIETKKKAREIIDKDILP